MKYWMALVLAMMAGVVLANSSATAPALPPVFATITGKARLDVIDRFEAAPGLIGWAVRIDGKPTILYTTENGGHILVGKLFDQYDHDLTLKQWRQYFSKTDIKTPTPADFEKLAWFAEGARYPEKVVYVFFDPYCGYCHKLWRLVKHYEVQYGLQVRYLPVAVVSDNSLKAAAHLLQAKNPLAVLRQMVHGRYLGHGDADSRSVERVTANTRMMLTLGLNGTPAMVWWDQNRLHTYTGLPEQSQLDLILRPRVLSQETEHESGL